MKKNMMRQMMMCTPYMSNYYLCEFSWRNYRQ
jgi:hypothetical protein